MIMYAPVIDCGPLGKYDYIYYYYVYKSNYINLINKSYRCLSVVLLGNMYTKDLATALKSHVHVYMYTCMYVCVCVYVYVPEGSCNLSQKSAMKK